MFCQQKLPFFLRRRRQRRTAAPRRVAPCRVPLARIVFVFRFQYLPISRLESSGRLFKIERSGRGFLAIKILLKAGGRIFLSGP